MHGGFLGGSGGKNPTTMQESEEMRIQPLGWEDPLKGIATHSIILAGESYGQRSLVGYSPRGRRLGQDWSDLPHVRERCGEEKGEEVEHRWCLGQWSCSAWHCSDGYISHICKDTKILMYHTNVSHWILMYYTNVRC